MYACVWKIFFPARFNPIQDGSFGASSQMDGWGSLEDATT